MENQEQNIRSWDDLIFENRNKSYGAYAIRQEYSNGVLKGLLVSIGFAAAIFAVAGVLNESKIIQQVADDLGKEITVSSIPNIDQVKPPAQKPVEPVRQTNQNLTPIAVITPDPVEPDPQPATTSTGTEGTPDGTGTPDTGTSSGGTNTGTDVGTEPINNNQFLMHAEVMPAYKGGLEGMIKTLKKNMKYPASARRMGKEGTVFVEFVVSREGDIKDVKVVRGFDLDCDKEAVRIVEKLVEWTPGLQNKVAVNVKLVIPIKFKLDQQ